MLEFGWEKFNKFLIMFARLYTRHWKLPFHNFFHNFAAAATTFLSPFRIQLRTILSFTHSLSSSTYWISLPLYVM